MSLPRLTLPNLVEVTVPVKTCTTMSQTTKVSEADLEYSAKVLREEKRETGDRGTGEKKVPILHIQ